MTVIQILDNDLDTIQRYIDYGRDKLNLKMNIENKNEFISDDLDHYLKNSVTVNKKKTNRLKKAFEGLNKIIDSEKKQLSLGKAREIYFKNKDDI